jgi:hypothetical protein
VRLRSARERTNKAYWIRLDQRAEPDQFGDIHAKVGDDGVVVVKTSGVKALTLAPPEALAPEGPLEVEIDGTRLSGARPLTLHRTSDGAWEQAPYEYPRPGHKRPGASGPIRDVYHDPLIFVVGTQDPDHTLINRLVARHWAHPRGWQVDYPIVADTEVTEEMAREHTLVLIGPPSSNLLHRRWASRFPIQIEGDAVRVGSRCHAGFQVGTVFIAPSPANPERSVLVIAGPWPLGTWRSLFLPDILPDYIVFDERIAPARGQWAVGGTGATSLEAGLFGMDWSVPQYPDMRSQSNHMK